MLNDQNLNEKETDDEENDSTYNQILIQEESMFSARVLQQFQSNKTSIAIVMNDKVNEITKYFYKTPKGNIKDILIPE